ncbi:hypothetical protein I4641_19030 [Waterburya agarophytonicola K14]|uniref:Uncharacterized protein n=1 Tax=Waterburya agarophytonicola KI4 TaxID=2874699 RepID=A0A964FGL6_9CYAN|nr:hypothetical protein [Waterburya agarophytonicola]MCC0179065.1 hypothetical protein [Waterburya agarophytonicola KI4]
MNYLYLKYLKNLALVLAKPLVASTTIFSLTSIQTAQAFTIDFKNPAVINGDGSRTINSSLVVLLNRTQRQ